MPAERRHGMDHPHHTWSPIHTRESLRWPDQARVALCVLVNLELMELDAPPEGFQYDRLAGGIRRLAEKPCPMISQPRFRQCSTR